MVCRLREPVGFKTFEIFLSPICRAVLIRSEGLKSIGLCFTIIVKQSTFLSFPASICNANLIVVVRIRRNGFILMVLIAENSSDLNYSRRPQLFRLRLKLKSIPQRPLRFVEELSCSYNIIVAFVELFYHRP